MFNSVTATKLFYKSDHSRHASIRVALHTEMKCQVEHEFRISSACDFRKEILVDLEHEPPLSQT